MSASQRCGLNVEYPQWIEVPSKSTATTYEKYINADITAKTHRAVVVLLPRFTYYAQVKRSLDRKGVISQVVLT